MKTRKSSCVNARGTRPAALHELTLLLGGAVGGTPSSLGWGVPNPVLGGGSYHRTGVPPSAGWGTPHPYLGWGTPPSRPGIGCPFHPDLRWGWDGVPAPPVQTWNGVPPPASVNRLKIDNLPSSFGCGR